MPLDIEFLTENVERILACVFKDRKLTVRMVLLQKLEIKKVCAKIVPKHLTPEQKSKKDDCCEDWLKSEKSGNFLNQVIYEDDSWFYEFDVDLKSQSKEWKLAGEHTTRK